MKITFRSIVLFAVLFLILTTGMVPYSDLTADQNAVVALRPGNPNTEKATDERQITNGLVAYYPFSGSANDLSGNGNNGTVYGATLAPDRFGNPNSAYSFDGVNDYIRVNYSNSLSFPHNLTVSAWIKTTDTAGGIAHEHNGGGSGNFAFGVQNGGKFRFGQSYDAYYSELYDSVYVNDWTWHLLVGVFDDTNDQVKHYVDGTLVFSRAETNSLPDYPIDLIIGDENNFLYPWGGMIDEVRLYNRALSDTEISALYRYESGLYSISGRVTDSGGNGIGGVTISAGTAGSTATDGNGNYTIGNLSAGTYTLTPSKAGYSFSPPFLRASVPPNVPDRNFEAMVDTPPPAPFLDLPFDYARTLSAFKDAVRDTKDKGQVNSWFDHKYPNGQYGSGDGIWLYNHVPIVDSLQIVDSGVWCYQGFCYDGHNGLDLVPKSDSQKEIHPAAAGHIVDFKPDCVKGDYTNNCGGFGNQIVLYHPSQGYFTRYGHLLSVNVSKADVTSSDVIGIMGSTGRSTGEHLHFGVYRDDGDGVWEEGIDAAVDPFGWKRDVADPWLSQGGRTSYRLWVFDPDQQTTFDGCQGALLADASGQVKATIPPCLFVGQTVLDLSSGPVAGASAQLRRGGRSFSMELIQGLLNLPLSPKTNIPGRPRTATLSQPITLTVNYTDTEVVHLNVDQLTLNHWNPTSGAWEPQSTVVDKLGRQVTAQSLELGDFDLQAPLLCPADTFEINDGYFASQGILPNQIPSLGLFDISEDQDWFRLDAVAGGAYAIRTTNLAAGVDTVVQIYDLDGVTLLGTDDNGGGGKASLLDWQAPQSGTYFIRVSPTPGSATGCNASYRLQVNHISTLLLPLILR